MKPLKRYSPTERERATRLVFDHIFNLFISLLHLMGFMSGANWR